MLDWSCGYSFGCGPPPGVWTPSLPRAAQGGVPRRVGRRLEETRTAPSLRNAGAQQPALQRFFSFWESKTSTFSVKKVKSAVKPLVLKGICVRLL